MLVIRPALPAELERLQGVILQLPVAGYIGENDGVKVGSGGLAWYLARCWLWFTVEDSRPEFALAAIRQGRRMKAMAKALGEATLYASRDPAAPTSEKLLRIMGFTRTDETVEGHEVYACPLT